MNNTTTSITIEGPTKHVVNRYNRRQYLQIQIQAPLFQILNHRCFYWLKIHENESLVLFLTSSFLILPIASLCNARFLNYIRNASRLRIGFMECELFMIVVYDCSKAR